MNTTSAICCEESAWMMTNASPIVFVVDDDISMRESLRALIQDEGWHVETFTSAEEFLNRPHEIVPHCLVLDISMPGLNGLELQKRLAVQQPDGESSLPERHAPSCGSQAEVSWPAGGRKWMPGEVLQQRVWTVPVA